MKRHLHLVVIYLCAVSLGSLSLPLFSTKYAGRELIMWGWDLWKVILFGKPVILAPFLLVLTIYLPISRRQRNLLLLLLVISVCICYPKALYMVHRSLQLIAPPYVRHHYGLVAYPQLILFALLLSYIRNGGHYGNIKQ